MCLFAGIIYKIEASIWIGQVYSKPTDDHYRYTLHIYQNESNIIIKLSSMKKELYNTDK